MYSDRALLNWRGDAFTERQGQLSWKREGLRTGGRNEVSELHLQIGLRCPMCVQVGALGDSRRMCISVPLMEDVKHSMQSIVTSANPLSPLASPSPSFFFSASLLSSEKILEGIQLTAVGL